MKTIFSTFFLFISLCSLGQLIPAMPEYNVLYRDYANKLIINSGCNDSIQVFYENELVPKTQIQFDYETSMEGYMIKPHQNLVYLVIQGYKSGNIVSSDTVRYKVKPFPFPIILNTRISKTTGIRLNVSLPAEFPLNTSYTILGGEVIAGDGVPFSGAVVPGSLVSKIKPGELVGITVSVRNNATNITQLINGVLEVIP